MAANHTESVDNLLRTSTSSSFIITSNGSDDAIVVPGSTSKSNKGTQWHKANWKRALEVVVLSCVILLVCGLFTIPTILYGLPPLQANEETSINISHSCVDDLDNSSSITLLCPNTSVEWLYGDVTCALGFYLDNSTLPACIPHCKSWLVVTAVDIVISICVILAIISCAILFVIVWLQKDTVLVFPTYYLIYICISTVFGGLILIIGALLKGEVFCTSDSFIESMMNSSPFCTISGVVNIYVAAQIALLATFHALGLGWSIFFPFHYRRLKVNERIKYIHAATLVLSLIVPAFPALLPLIHGYTVTSGPSEFCVTRDIDNTYYTVVVPISIFMAVATSVLVALFWRLFKEFILKQFHLGFQRPKGHVMKAEIKILVIMCYYVVVGILTLSTYSYYLATGDAIIRDFQSYFACQSTGIQPDRDCGDVSDVQLQEFTVAASMTYILQSLLPLVVLIFIVNCSCCKEKHLMTKNHTASEQCA